jgi:prepilin-type N-terminal cleavage/methylation domain-containing protein
MARAASIPPLRIADTLTPEHWAWICGDTLLHPRSRKQPRPRAFTLVELLVVIAVIAVLAALTFPIIGAVKRAQTIHRARAELTYLESAIEAYKTKLGFYPPDNGGYYTTNQLYYELMGTITTTIGGQPGYQTLDASATILNNGFGAAFGATTKVTGFVNCSKPGAGDDSPNAVKFLLGLKSAQFMAVNTPVTSTVLGSTVGGLPVFNNTATGGEITPYGYNSSNPQHNPKSFDLWIDVIAGGKTNRISNWSDKPIQIQTTAY